MTNVYEFLLMQSSLVSLNRLDTSWSVLIKYIWVCIYMFLSAEIFSSVNWSPFLSKTLASFDIDTRYALHNQMTENDAETAKNCRFCGFLVGAPQVLTWDVAKHAGYVAQMQN